MDAAELAWSATGAPGSLADTPKPTDIPDEHPTQVPAHALTREQLHADLDTYDAVMDELRTFGDYLPEYTAEAIRTTLGSAHDNLEEAAGTIRALIKEPDEVTLRRWRDTQRDLHAVAEGNVPAHMARDIAGKAAEAVDGMLQLIGGAR